MNMWINFSNFLWIFVRIFDDKIFGNTEVRLFDLFLISFKFIIGFISYKLLQIFQSKQAIWIKLLPYESIDKRLRSLYSWLLCRTAEVQMTSTFHSPLMAPKYVDSYLGWQGRLRGCYERFHTPPLSRSNLSTLFRVSSNRNATKVRDNHLRNENFFEISLRKGSNPIVHFFLLFFTSFFLFFNYTIERINETLRTHRNIHDEREKLVTPKRVKRVCNNNQ